MVFKPVVARMEPYRLGSDYFCKAVKILEIRNSVYPLILLKNWNQSHFKFNASTRLADIATVFLR